MKYFINTPYTAESLKAEFRALCLTMHPDKGGNAEEFKTMSAEYYDLLKNVDGTTAREAEEARQRAEEARREREEREREAREYEAREKARREREEAEERERIRKAQEVTAAAVRAWAQILERIPATVSGKKRAYSFDDKKALAAYIAATKRNIKAVINHYFPGLDVKVTISGEIWKEKFSIAWEDGPTADELRKTCKELEFFVPSYYESDPYADYGDYRERKGSAPWREAYGGGLGDATDYDTARTLSEEGEEQAANIAAGIFADFDPAKLHKNNEHFKMTLTEWHKFAELCGIDGVFRHFENLIRCYSGNNEGMAYYSSLRRYLRDYVKVSVTKKEKAPEFKPTYGPTLKAIKKALGGNVFAKVQETKRRENDWTPCDFSVLLGDLQGVKLCKPYCYDMETYWSPVYFTSYKTESTRREKFEAVGITMDGASVKAVREDVAAKIREELADIERQRKEWERKQNEPKAEKKATKGEKASKPTEGTPATETTATANESEPKSNADGLTMEQYSEKATVIRGYTAEQAAELEAMGGKEWRNLKGGKGYIFSTRRHGDKLREWFDAQQAGETAQAAAEPEPEPQTADTLEKAGEITDTNDEPTTADEPKQEEKRDELKQWHVEELIKGELRKHHLFTDDRNEAAEYMAAKLEELQQAEGVEILSTKKGRVIWYEGGKYHLLYIWNLDESRSMYWMARDSERHRILREYAERHAAAMKRKAEQEAQQTATASAPADDQPTVTPLEPKREISALFEAVADFFGTLARISQEAARFEGVTIPAATLARWKADTEQGTRHMAEKFAEVCACLASLTPDSRRDFDALGVIFWTLAEQIRNGYDPATIQTATDYARAQLFDLIDRTQTTQQAAALREAFDTFREAA